MSKHILHLMGPSIQRAIGAVVGDRAALQGLREALDQALTTGAGGTWAWQSDGEPYLLAVALEKCMYPVQTEYAAVELVVRSERETTPIEALNRFDEGRRKALIKYKEYCNRNGVSVYQLQQDCTVPSEFILL